MISYLTPPTLLPLTTKTLEVVDWVPPSGPSATLSGGTAETGAEDGMVNPESPAKYKTHDPM